MQVFNANGTALHVRIDGPEHAPAVVFANSLGTDLRLWDAALPLLPRNLRYIRFDKRGHGLSDCPIGPYSIDTLTDDAEALIEGLALGPVVFVGLSVGGMIGQCLAARRPDLVRALVLSNSAARMGTPAMWQDRITAIAANGIASMEGAILDRWFGPAFRNTPEAALWGAMVTRTPQAGYSATCAALAAADLTDGTRNLRLPALAIAGSDDKASPPDLVRATADLIPGAAFHCINGAGHLPCVDSPVAFANILSAFLKDQSHAPE